jgi:hypothetical protein
MVPGSVLSVGLCQCLRPGESELGEPIRAGEDHFLPILNGCHVRSGLGGQQCEHLVRGSHPAPQAVAPRPQRSLAG